MGEHIRDVLNEAVDNNNLKLITERLSFEERDYLVNHVDVFYDFLGEKMNNVDELLLFSSLYTLNEAMSLLDNIETYTSYKKLAIILKLPTDELKIKYLDKLSDEEKIVVINGFNDEKLKIQCLDKISDDKQKADIINELSDDKLKIQYLDKINDDGAKANIINKLSDDELKIQYLDKINDDGAKANIINKLSDDELKIQCLDKINDDFCKAYIIEGLSNDKLKIQCLDKINDDVQKAIIIKKLSDDKLKIQCLDKINDDVQKAIVIKDLSDDKLKIQYLDKVSEDSYKIDIISSFKSEDLILSGLEKIGEPKIEQFKRIKNCCNISLHTQLSLMNLYNKNINRIIHDEGICNKFIALFNSSTASLNKTYIDSVLEAILSKEFSQNKSDVWEVFSRIKGMSERGEVENITQELFDILKYSQNTKNLVGRELGQFITDFKNDKNFLTNFIIELIDKNPQIRQNALDRLKKVTSQYINLQMEDYKIGRKYQIFADNLLKINRKVERNYLLKYITEHYDTNALNSLIGRFYPEKLSLDYFSNGITLKDVLEWKTKDPKNAPKEIKLCFKELNKILIQLYEEHYDEMLNMLKAPESEIKYDEKLEINNSVVLSTMLSECDLEEFFELCSSENSEKYKIIMDLIEKYHLIGLGDNFNSLLSDTDIAEFDLKKFVDNILEIADTLEKRKKEVNLIDILNVSDNLNKNLANLLGKDNLRLLVTNPGPNPALMTKAERLIQIPEYIKAMYERRKINVPTLNEEISLNDGKKISINIGNLTNPINLTYGERTGACMRIGGVGSKLFDFCIKNNAGFHINFSSNEGKFASRVSGFRVGNTVFLNELRNSVLDEYTDEDIRLACQKAANKMIELSKDSESPIENVVIANQYIFGDSIPSVHFNVEFSKDGTKAPGYFDVNPDNCVLVATSNNDNAREYVPFKDTEMPEYLVLRDKVKYISNSTEINAAISKVKMVNNILQDEDYNDVVDETTEYAYAYVGEDFYVAVDKLGNVKTYIMPNTKDKERAKIEMEEALNRLKGQVKSIQMEQNNMITNNFLEDSPSYGDRGGRGSRGQITFLLLMSISFILSIITIIFGIVSYK
mgnify:CR=1 FL=1